MPTKTFYRLPEEKRQRLKKAILQELARVPAAEMSINRIIQAAEIPRGSYYQYFTDKNDVMSYILHEYKNCMIELIRQCREEAEGDLYQLCRTLFFYTLEYGMAKENISVFRNIFPNLRLSDLLAECDAEMHDGELMIFGEEGDRLRTEILLAVLKDSVVKAFTTPANAEKIKSDFEEKIKILQKIPEV